MRDCVWNYTSSLSVSSATQSRFVRNNSSVHRLHPFLFSSLNQLTTTRVITAPGLLFPSLENKDILHILASQTTQPAIAITEKHRVTWEYCRFTCIPQKRNKKIKKQTNRAEGCFKIAAKTAWTYRLQQVCLILGEIKRKVMMYTLLGRPSIRER